MIIPWWYDTLIIFSMILPASQRSYLWNLALSALEISLVNSKLPSYRDVWVAIESVKINILNLDTIWYFTFLIQYLFPFDISIRCLSSTGTYPFSWVVWSIVHELLTLSIKTNALCPEFKPGVWHGRKLPVTALLSTLCTPFPTTLTIIVMINMTVKVLIKEIPNPLSMSL